MYVTYISDTWTATVGSYRYDHDGAAGPGQSPHVVRIAGEKNAGAAPDRLGHVPSDALATLELEARRRGVAMTAVVSEAVVEKAAALRRARRPRLGTGASGGRSPGAALATADPVADDPR